MSESEREYIYHYTNIETLDLILKHGTIRFTRLDEVDDLSESEAFGDIDFSNLIFVSCWTYEQQENIPQWHMYTNQMRGVRIQLPKDFFHYKEVKLNDPDLGITSIDTPKLPIGKNEMFTDTYHVFPFSFLKKYFERKIEYKDNIDSVYENFFDETVAPDGKNQINFNNLGDLAKFKSKAWSFQQEIRYVLLIFPAFEMPSEGFNDQSYISSLGDLWYKAIKTGNGPPITNFDLPIDPVLLNNITVRTGPMCTKEDEIAVESIINNYTTNGEIQKSKLAGKINL
ncbi:MAG: hypothetical protein ACQETE_12525 [Bacteroidota bacterium]